MAARTMSAGLAVQIRDARKSFGTRQVLDGADLDIRSGEFVALLGASGSGKTTLLRILAGLEDLDSGIALVPEARTVVFQEPRLIPSKRVHANVALGRPRGAATAKAVRAVLEEVGLERHADSWPATLSGGEAQRAALARALVSEPELLLLDEPFGALDALTRLKMHALLAVLCARHRPAVLLVTHDVEEAILLADRVVVLADGKLIQDVEIDIGRPRDRSDERFQRLRRDLLKSLGVVEA